MAQTMRRRILFTGGSELVSTTAAAADGFAGARSVRRAVRCLHSGRTIDRLDYPSPNLRRINSVLPGVANFRGYTSTLLTESKLYNFPSNRDYSLRSKTNY